MTTNGRRGRDDLPEHGRRSPRRSRSLRLATNALRLAPGHQFHHLYYQNHHHLATKATFPKTNSLSHLCYEQFSLEFSFIFLNLPPSDSYPDFVLVLFQFPLRFDFDGYLPNVAGLNIVTMLFENFAKKLFFAELWIPRQQGWVGMQVDINAVMTMIMTMSMIMMVMMMMTTRYGRWWWRQRSLMRKFRLGRDTAWSFGTITVLVSISFSHVCQTSAICLTIPNTGDNLGGDCDNSHARNCLPPPGKLNCFQDWQASKMKRAILVKIFFTKLQWNRISFRTPLDLLAESREGRDGAGATTREDRREAGGQVMSTTTAPDPRTGGMVSIMVMYRPPGAPPPPGGQAGKTTTDQPPTYDSIFLGEQVCRKNYSLL